MSEHPNNPETPHEEAHESDTEQDDSELNPEDVIEVVEDDGDEPMDDDDEDNENYDGEIIIGGPGPGEEDEYMDEEVHGEDNSWGASGMPSPYQLYL
jgi:ribosome assembly protein SQT1